MNTFAKAALLVGGLLSISGCAHRYADRTLSFVIAREDKPAVEAMLKGLYSPTPGNCLDKAIRETTQVGNPLDIGKGTPPILGAEVSCLRETAKAPYDYDGVDACLYDPNSATTDVMIVSSSIADTYGNLPGSPSNTALNRGKRIFWELRSAMSAAGIKTRLVSSKPYYLNWRICGDYK